MQSIDHERTIRSMVRMSHLRRKEKLMRQFEKFGIRPHTRRGQNFLLDKNQVYFIARTGELAPDDVVLEVGPGTGFLTCAMAPVGCTVLGCELDTKLLELVKSETEDFPNVLLMHGDILASKTVNNPEVEERLLELMKLRGGDTHLKCVSNLPYSAGTPFVANMFTSTLPWELGVFMLQLEVAERLVSSHGKRQYGSLSIVAALGGKAKIVRRVPPQVFWPRPRVASAVVRVRFKSVEERQQIPWKSLRRVTSTLFSARRKSLRNALKGLIEKEKVAEVVEQVGLDPKARAQELEPEQFLALAKYLEESET